MPPAATVGAALRAERAAVGPSAQTTSPTTTVGANSSSAVPTTTVAAGPSTSTTYRRPPGPPTSIAALPDRHQLHGIDGAQLGTVGTDDTTRPQRDAVAEGELRPPCARVMKHTS